MDRRHVLSISGALAAMALAGCTGPSSTPPDTSTESQDETPTRTPEETPKNTPNGSISGAPGADLSGEPRADDTRLAELASGNAAFALDLHDHLAAKGGGNQFLSPYSISVALAMTFAGASDETREQIAETMRYTLGEAVHPAFDGMQSALADRETAEDPIDGDTVDAFQLSVANALWGSEGFPFADDYLSILEDHYGAGLRRADFGGDPDGERERINQWVAEITEDRIDDLLPPRSITPSTVLVLANAIFFKAGWTFEFDLEETTAGTFTALDGSESTVPLMRQNVRTNYASFAGGQAVELPYVGEEVSMVLMLPDEGEFETFERDLDADRLFGIFGELSDMRGDLALPRFEFETKVQLSTALADLGMPDAFGSGADFGGMVEGDGSGPWIDEVYHQAYVSVDEEGTEAAGATAVVMEVSRPPSWGELRFDRPFLFCIRDRPTDAVLFLGRVVDAGEAQGE